MNASKITLTSDITVELIQHTGSDALIAAAARVSTGADMKEFSAGVDAKLINYLVKNRHGSPLEHNSMTFRVSVPIFVMREWMRHRVGWCLPGSAEISVGTWNQTKKIKDIYSDWKLGVSDSMGRTRMLPSTRNLSARTINLDNGLVEMSNMVDVFESGVKEILKITTTSGRTLRCTADHRIWTPVGWVRAGDLQYGALIGRVGRVAVGERQGIPKRLREGIQFWTTEMRNELIQDIDTCSHCFRLLEKSELELDHVIPVKDDIARALDKNNLAVVCTDCHQLKTNTEGETYGSSRRRALANGVRFEGVVSVVPDGEEMTYDISMPPPHHNFIADGFVVHNSYNEVSGRYKKLDAKFYIYPATRPLVQEGTSSHPELVHAHPALTGLTNGTLKDGYKAIWKAYESMLDDGVANEVARAILPVGLYTEAYVTCNARSLMSFLSLRVDADNSQFETKPQWEIQQAALAMEEKFAVLFPATYEAFNLNGRVAP